MSHSTDTLIIGAGQAGLSLSHHLTRAGHAHAVLERGRIGERWRSERWDSLTLLTPGWLSRLDGSEPHPDPDAFLGREDFVAYLDRYARSFDAPVHEHVAVSSVTRSGRRFHVDTSAGTWRARNVVIATGDSAEPRVPAAAAAAPPELVQLHANGYRNPAALPDGGVLVVGAGPSGLQIAAELRRAGRRVALAVGRHARVPRRYRGRDIWHWLDAIGDLERTIDEVPDPAASKRAPSVALSGANGGEHLDLAVLHRLGVTVTGRLETFDSGRAVLAGDLQPAIDDSERRLRRLLDRIDDHVDRTHEGRWPHPPDRPAEVRLPEGPAGLDLAAHGISTVIWATGYRREYPWLRVPVLDADGEIVHRHGITPVPGLYVLGLKFQRRRASHFVGGVGADAAWIAHGIARAGVDRPAAAPPRPNGLRRRHELVRRACDALSVFRQRAVGVTDRPVAHDPIQVLR
jgi:putative flavoprotein involved in K+ transport